MFFILSSCFQNDDKINCTFNTFSHSEELACYESIKSSALALSGVEQEKFFKAFSSTIESLKNDGHTNDELKFFQEKFNGLTAKQVVDKYYKE